MSVFDEGRTLRSVWQDRTHKKCTITGESFPITMTDGKFVHFSMSKSVCGQYFAPGLTKAEQRAASTVQRRRKGIPEAIRNNYTDEQEEFLEEIRAEQSDEGTRNTKKNALLIGAFRGATAFLRSQSDEQIELLRLEADTYNCGTLFEVAVDDATVLIRDAKAKSDFKSKSGDPVETKTGKVSISCSNGSWQVQMKITSMASDIGTPKEGDLALVSYNPLLNTLAYFFVPNWAWMGGVGNGPDKGGTVLMKYDYRTDNYTEFEQFRFETYELLVDHINKEFA